MARQVKSLLRAKAKGKPVRAHRDHRSKKNRKRLIKKTPMHRIIEARWAERQED